MTRTATFPECEDCGESFDAPLLTYPGVPTYSDFTVCPSCRKRRFREGGELPDGLRHFLAAHLPDSSS